MEFLSVLDGLCFRCLREDGSVGFLVDRVPDQQRQADDQHTGGDRASLAEPVWALASGHQKACAQRTGSDRERKSGEMQQVRPGL